MYNLIFSQSPPDTLHLATNWFYSWVGGWEDPLEKEMATHSVFLPGEFHGQRSLEGYSPKGCKELDMIKGPSTQHHFHKSITFISFNRNVW